MIDLSVEPSFEEIVVGMVVQVYFQCRHSIVLLSERGVDELVVFQAGEYGFNFFGTVVMREPFQVAAGDVFFGEPECKRFLG